MMRRRSKPGPASIDANTTRTSARVQSLHVHHQDRPWRGLGGASPQVGALSPVDPQSPKAQTLDTPCPVR